MIKKKKKERKHPFEEVNRLPFTKKKNRIRYNKMSNCSVNYESLFDGFYHGCNNHSIRCASSQSFPKNQCQSTKHIHPHDNLSSLTIKAKS